LHLIMKAPVWFIIERISGIIGGGGYHRSELIDQAIKNFDDWWLVGTVYTAHWLPYYLPVSPGYVDITNEFIAQGVTGGVLKLVLFIWIIALAFKIIGNGIHNQELPSKLQSMLKSKLSKRFNALFRPRDLTIQNRKTSSLQIDNRLSDKTLKPFLPESKYGISLLYWSLGVSLLAHIVSFISVSYFDQMIVFFYLLLSMIGVVSATELQANKESLKTSKTISTRRIFSKEQRATGHPVLFGSRK